MVVRREIVQAFRILKYVSSVLMSAFRSRPCELDVYLLNIWSYIYFASCVLPNPFVVQTTSKLCNAYPRTFITGILLASATIV